MDRVRLIHAICSSSVEGLPVGRGSYAFFLNPKGRIQSDSHIFRERDHLLIHCEEAATAKLLDHIESYIIMDDVAVEDVTSQETLIAVAGGNAARVAARLGLELPDRPLGFTSSGGFRCYRAPTESVDCWFMFPAFERPRVLSALRGEGFREATAEAWQALRMSHWVPRFGVDFGPAHLPHETRQLQAVSFSKGCYTGQEIVERVRSQGRVRRELVGIELRERIPPADLTVFHEDRKVGVLTSPTPATGHPDGRARGFAIVRRAATAPGTIVRVGDMEGRVRSVARTGLS